MLSGVAVHETRLRGLLPDIARPKRDFSPGAGSSAPELHAQRIWNSCGEFRGGGHALELEGKRRIFGRAVDIACGPDARLIGIAVDKGSDAGTKGRSWPLEQKLVTIR